MGRREGLGELLRSGVERLGWSCLELETSFRLSIGGGESCFGGEDDSDTFADSTSSISGWILDVADSLLSFCAASPLLR